MLRIRTDVCGQCGSAALGVETQGKLACGSCGAPYEERRCSSCGDLVAGCGLPHDKPCQTCSAAPAEERAWNGLAGQVERVDPEGARLCRANETSGVSWRAMYSIHLERCRQRELGWSTESDDDKGPHDWLRELREAQTNLEGELRGQVPDEMKVYKRANIMAALCVALMEAIERRAPAHRVKGPLG